MKDLTVSDSSSGSSPWESKSKSTMKERVLPSIGLAIEDNEDTRGKGFFHKMGVILSLAGCAIGFGNLQKFPTVVAKGGGLSFVLIYVIVSIFICYPFVYMEVFMGQMSKGSPADAGRMSGNERHGYLVCSIFAILGVLSFYSTLQGTAIYYLTQSPSQNWYMTDALYNDALKYCPDLDFAECYKDEEIDRYCVLETGPGPIHYPLSCRAMTQLEFSLDFQGNAFPANVSYAAEVIPGMEETPLTVNWFLYGLIALNAFLVFAIAGLFAKYVPMASNIIMIPLILMLFGMLIFSCTLPGASDGIYFYVGRFEWESLLDYTQWKYAITQAVFSCSLGSFAVPMLSSMSNSKTAIGTSAFCVVLLDTMFGLISGFVVFGVLGYVSGKTGTSVEELAANGDSSLVYSTYAMGISLYFDGGIGGAVVSTLFFLLFSMMGFSSIYAITSSIIQCFVGSRLMKRVIKTEKKRELIVSSMVLLFMVAFGPLNASDYAVPALIQSIDNFVTYLMLPLTLVLEGYWFCYQADESYSDRVIGPIGNALTRMVFWVNALFAALMLYMFPDSTLGGGMWFAFALPIPVASHFLFPIVYERFNGLGYQRNLYHSFCGFSGETIRRFNEYRGGEKSWMDNILSPSFTSGFLKTVALPCMTAYTAEYTIGHFLYQDMTVFTENEMMVPMYGMPAWCRFAGLFFPIMYFMTIMVVCMMPLSFVRAIQNPESDSQQGLMARVGQHAWGYKGSSVLHNHSDSHSHSQD